MRRRLTALILAIICLCLSIISGAEGEPNQLPILNIDVFFGEFQDDGQVDAKITVYYFRGKGTYEQTCMENLRVTVTCLNGLETDQEIFDLGSPDSFRQVIAHLSYTDPGPAYHPDTNDEDRPTLKVHATTLNCGEADYQCLFDARAQAYGVFLYQTTLSEPECIRESHRIVESSFSNYACQYNRIKIFPNGENPDSVFKMIDYARDADDNDITYFHFCTHGTTTNGRPDGCIAMYADENRYVSIKELLQYITKRKKSSPDESMKTAHLRR